MTTTQDNKRVTDIVFIDGGSNMNFVTHTLAGKLGLVGTQTNIYFRVVDEQYREKEVLVFRLGVEDKFKDINWMEAVGVDSITDAAPLQDEAGIQKAYPEIKEEALNRPVGPAGLLILMTERRLHAGGGQTIDIMRLSDTMLVCGQVLTGVAPKRTGPKSSERLSAECRAMQGARADKPPQGQAFCTWGLGRAAESFGFIKDSCRSTKCKVACDTARKNAYTGLSSDDEMDQLQDVLSHFRSVEIAVILDVEKAYQSIHTSEKEKHLMRTV